MSDTNPASKKEVKCVVACRDAAGAPDFVAYRVQCTQEEYDLGEHYQLAEDEATACGYEEPMLCYDENDGPDWLFEQFDWAQAAVIETGEDLEAWT